MEGWAVAESPILVTTITLERLKKRGYEPMLDYYLKVSPQLNELLKNNFSDGKTSNFIKNHIYDKSGQPLEAMQSNNKKSINFIYSCNNNKSR